MNECFDDIASFLADYEDVVIRDDEGRSDDPAVSPVAYSVLPPGGSVTLARRVGVAILRSDRA